MDETLDAYALANWIAAHVNTITGVQLRSALVVAGGRALTRGLDVTSISTSDLDEALTWVRGDHEVVFQERYPERYHHHHLECRVAEEWHRTQGGPRRTRVLRGEEICAVADEQERAEGDPCACLSLARRYTVEGDLRGVAARHSQLLLARACELACRSDSPPITLAQQISVELHPRLRRLDPLHHLLREALIELTRGRVGAPRTRAPRWLLVPTSTFQGGERDAEIAAQLARASVGRGASGEYLCVNAAAIPEHPSPDHFVYAESPRSLSDAEVSFAAELAGEHRRGMQAAVNTILEATTSFEDSTPER